MRHRLFIVALLGCIAALGVTEPSDATSTTVEAPPEFEISHYEPNPAYPPDAHHYQIPEYEFYSFIDQKTGRWNYNRSNKR